MTSNGFQELKYYGHKQMEDHFKQKDQPSNVVDGDNS